MKKCRLKTLTRAKVVFSVLFISLAFTAAAQDNYTRPANVQTTGQNTQQQTTSSATDSLPKFYLGIGTGVNNYTGILGVGIDFRVYHSVILRAGIGIGTWGSKVTIGVRYEMEQFKGRGWVMGLSYSYCSGLSNFQTQLAVDTSTFYAGTVNKQVTLNLLPASTLNLTASYNWTFHKHNKFYLEFGYALALQSAPYEVLDGSMLDYTSQIVLKELSPGGLVLDLGFMFAL